MHFTARLFIFFFAQELFFDYNACMKSAEERAEIQKRPFFKIPLRKNDHQGGTRHAHL
jgi:hypothetical protein